MSNLRRHYMMAGGSDTYSDFSPTPPVLKEGLYAIRYKSPLFEKFALTDYPIKSSNWHTFLEPFTFVKNWYYGGEGMWIFEGELPQAVGGFWNQPNDSELMAGALNAYRAINTGNLQNINEMIPQSCEISDIWLPEGVSLCVSLIAILAICPPLVWKNEENPTAIKKFDCHTTNAEILLLDALNPLSTSLEIPASILDVSYSSYDGTWFSYSGGNSYITNLEAITVSPNNVFYDSRDNCNAIIETATNTLIAGCQNTTIPDSVRSLKKWSFVGYPKTEMVLHKNLTYVDKYAFYQSSIRKVYWDLPTHLDYDRNIELSMFNSLSEIVFGENVEYIPSHIHDGHLSAVTIPENVHRMGYSFYNVLTVNINSNYLLIGNLFSAESSWASAFGNNVQNINIGPKMESLTGYNFMDFLSLLTISVDPDNPNYLSEGSVIFDKNKLYIYASAPKTSYSVPNGVTAIQLYAFYDKKLLTVSLPESLKIIWQHAFYGCPLTEVYVYAINPPDLAANAFGQKFTCYIPKGSLLVYLNDLYWPQYVSEFIEMD